MTAYDFGDVVLVPFPFTDQTGMKKRPAIVVSFAAYNAARRDMVVMAITSQIRTSAGLGDTTVLAWAKAGLLKPSVIKPVFSTIEKGLILKRLGALEPSDRIQLQTTIRSILA